MRLHDMDRLGADLQVVYPTLFLTFLTHDVHFEVALCKAYNRFLANVYSRCPDRLTHRDRHGLWPSRPCRCTG